jgi:hypothetical protein
METIWNSISSLLKSNTELLGAAIVAAIVSAAVSYFFKKRETRYKLEAEYEYEQRKKLRNLIGEFHGRMLNAANSLNYRLWNIYSNHKERWLDVSGDYSLENHYFHSSVYRFLVVSVLIRQFERKAIYVDGRIAEKNDFLFLRYVAVLHWCMTDVVLLSGLEYDKEHETDHFFSDNFRQYCDSCIKLDDSIIGFDELAQRVQNDRTLDPVLSFFDGLSPDEKRYRWDRLVAFHLLLIGFINTFGYKEQETSQKKIQQVAAQIKHPEILGNIVSWLPRHGLIDKKGGKRILRVCKTMLSSNKARNSDGDAASSL